MTTRSTLTSKGQITLPVEVRRRLGLQAGDRLEFIEDGAGFRVQKYVVASPFAKYRGYLTHLAGQTTDELLDELRGE
jgi:AbrB family looped-hinge helix DNA binding protein